MNQINLEKGVFASIKGHLYLRKGHLDYLEGQLEVESPLTGNKEKRVFFFKRALFKGYLCNKTVSQNVSSEGQVKNFLFCRKVIFRSQKQTL